MTKTESLVELLLNRLGAESDNIRRQWAAPVGTSTCHFVVDDLLPEELCEEIFLAFPRDAAGFFSRESFRERKRTSADLSSYPAILSGITYAFQDPRVVEFVAACTGMTQLEPDPKLYAGGLSMMFAGDFLNPHIDNSHDAMRQRYRRLNLLYYVSPEWTLEDDGNFELWDDGRQVAKTIVSARNRLVVMETDRSSWHSVSPVQSDMPRCCVSNYYFSKVSPDETDYFHVTSFSGRPEQAFRRVLGVVDNTLRNLVARMLKVGRGRNRVNEPDRPDKPV